LDEPFLLLQRLCPYGRLLLSRFFTLRVVGGQRTHPRRRDPACDDSAGRLARAGLVVADAGAVPLWPADADRSLGLALFR
jgi:hypothetical protein